MKPIIDRITWDRIWIIFHFQSDPGSYQLRLRSIDAPDGFDMPLIPDGPHSLKINITNPGNCAMLPEGIYQIVASDNSPVELNDEINAKYLNRQFVYYHEERAYQVQFSNRNGFKIKASDIRLKKKGVAGQIKSSIRRLRNNLAKQILRSIYNILFKLCHGKGSEPRILLMSDISEEMGSNMAALRTALNDRSYKTYESLRAVTTKHYSLFHWIRTLRRIAQADFIFLDDHSQTTDWLTIRDTTITQLWHAGPGFKSTGYSRFGMPASPAPWSGHRQYTYGIAGSVKIRHFFSEVWGINDDMVLPTGMPRLDRFLDPKNRSDTTARLLSSHPELVAPDGSKRNIILFAPTYRGENKRHAYYPYDRLDMNRLYSLCTEHDYIMIFKMHPFISESVPIPEGCRDRLIDMSDYPDINDLLYITDLLITDYSSNIYEYSLMHRPMLFYAFDIDKYSKERGFHRDYRQNVPGKIVETFDDMIHAIASEDYEYDRVEEYISNNIDHIDSLACSRIIDWIIEGGANKSS